MRTLLLIAVLMGLISGFALAEGGEVDSTRSRTITAAECFLDIDPGEGNGIPVTATFGGSQVTINLNISPPAQSVLYLRVRSSNTTWSAPRALVTGTPYENPDATITAAEYFIGLDPGEGNATPLTLLSGGRIAMDLSGLTVGQAVYVRFRDSAGRWSSPRGLQRTSAFPSDDATLSILEYYVGDDPGPGQGTAMTFDAAGQAERELPGLLPGQIVNLRAQDSAGRWGDARRRRFEFGGIRAGQMFAKYASGDSSSVVALSIEADDEPGSVLFTGLGSLQIANPIDSVFVRFQSDTYTWGPWLGKLFFGVPELLYPTDGAPHRQPDITFRWRRAADADSYDFQLAEDAAFQIVVANLTGESDSSVIVNDLRHSWAYYWRARSVGDPLSDLTGLADTSVTVGPLLHEAQYFWRVRSASGPDTSAWSGVRDFTTWALLPPQLVTPAAGADNVSTVPQLVWHRAVDAVAYDLQLARDAGFADMVSNPTALPDTAFAALPLDRNRAWVAQVAVQEFEAGVAGVAGSGLDSRSSQFTHLPSALKPDLSHG